LIDTLKPFKCDFTFAEIFEFKGDPEVSGDSTLFLQGGVDLALIVQNFISTLPPVNEL
jgi:hypothetical protein